MNCQACGGHMEEQTTRFCACEKAMPIIVEDVPTYVCTQCGAKAFSDATLQMLERATSGAAPLAKMLTLLAYDFKTLGQEQPNPPIVFEFDGLQMPPVASATFELLPPTAVPFV
ncbi:MAG: YgiT-type zinc finger protein [Chloroflexota bacterium]